MMHVLPRSLPKAKVIHECHVTTVVVPFYIHTDIDVVTFTLLTFTLLLWNARESFAKCKVLLYDTVPGSQFSSPHHGLTLFFFSHLLFYDMI